MDDGTSPQAMHAAISHNNAIIGIKTDHEQQIAASVESANMSALHAAFRLGFDAGVRAEQAKKD